MKISARIFLGYFFIVGLGVFWLLNTFMAELRPGTRQAMEEMMVDTANLLAELVEREMAAGTIGRGEFSAGMADFLARESKLAELARKRLHVRLDVPAGLAVEAEEFLLRQSLATLLDNAIAFSPVGGGITISAQVGGARCEISVCDRGPGIPAFAEEKVFDRFYSLPRPDTGKKSSGLGLSFAREAMVLHRGGVRVENRPEGGLRAVLVLPMECVVS